MTILSHNVNDYDMHYILQFEKLIAMGGDPAL